MGQRSLLAIEAHADDFELSALSLLKQFTSVTVLAIALPIPAERFGEFHAAAAKLHYQAVTFGFPDGHLSTKDFRHYLAGTIKELRPTTVATHDPWKPYLLHGDHRAVGIQVCDAITALRADGLYLPEELILWNAGIPDCTLYVTPKARKVALSFYQSQDILQRCVISEMDKFRHIRLEEELG